MAVAKYFNWYSVFNLKNIFCPHFRVFRCSDIIQFCTDPSVGCLLQWSAPVETSERCFSAGSLVMSKHATD